MANMDALGLSSWAWIPILFVLFILVREVVTWYWKINRIVDLLEQIEENTRPKEEVETDKTAVG